MYHILDMICLKKSPEIFENSINESLDPGYLIGLCDEIIIMLWGANWSLIILMWWQKMGTCL